LWIDRDCRKKKKKTSKEKKKRRCICVKRERIDTCMLASSLSWKGAQNTNITKKRMKKTRHIRWIVIYTHTHAQEKTRPRKNYDEKQKNRIKEGFFSLFFFSLSFFLLLHLLYLTSHLCLYNISHLSLFFPTGQLIIVYLIMWLSAALWI
jgi:hypothetical protein